MMLLGRRAPGPPAGDDRRPEHAERERGQRQARLQRVVFEDHLQVDRDGDHRAAERDVLEHLPGDPEPEQLGREQRRIDQRRLALALPAHEPVREPGEGDGADRQEQADGFAALLPDEDAQHQAAHAEDRQNGADEVDLARACVRRVTDESDARQHDRDDDDLEQERDAVGEVRGDEAADQGSDGRCDRGRRPDQGVGRLLGRPFEVAVDERLHRGQQERRAEATDDGPEDEDRPSRFGPGPSPARRSRRRGGPGHRRACVRRGRRSCCRSG